MNDTDKYEDEYDDEDEDVFGSIQNDEETVLDWACDHEWEVDRVTDWGMNGSRVVHVCVDIYCPKCETYGNTDGSWEFDDEDVV